MWHEGHSGVRLRILLYSCVDETEESSRRIEQARTFAAQRPNFNLSTRIYRGRPGSCQLLFQMFPVTECADGIRHRIIESRHTAPTGFVSNFLPLWGISIASDVLEVIRLAALPHPLPSHAPLSVFYGLAPVTSPSFPACCAPRFLPLCASFLHTEKKDGYQHFGGAEVRQAAAGGFEAHGLPQPGARGHQARQHPRGPGLRVSQARRLRVRRGRVEGWIGFGKDGGREG